MSQRPNAYDVAKLAGVSQTTVSRVLNDFPYVRPATRMKVLNAIEELGFKPDEIARSLVKKKTNTIGLIVGNLANPFYAETAQVILNEASKLNYDVIMMDGDSKNESLSEVLSKLLNRRVDGVIVATVKRREELTVNIVDSTIPILFFNRSMDNLEQANYVIVDDLKGSKIAMQYLIENGHKNIAYITITGYQEYSTFNDRFLGYKQALQDNGIAYNEELVFEANNHNSALDFSMNLLQTNPNVTAIFASTDSIALEVLEAISRCNKKVPEEISIMGFDDINIAGNPYVKLTTISQRKEEMSKLALTNLLALISGESSSPVQIVLEPKLIVRGTTKSTKG
ncbi:LacI family DNA-binding transcriptional regulator [Metasolibacillus sp. FSL H7-0170]|uniref:LacI family DNA-binding transcriptional regulator n=1 Tax=Metasolibacillus TaxID=2703677 RepID=UPI000D3C3C15|nr:LacI family DNA-binding transcriptional regulator [Metasolibacillus fluoroglycofenilyticus]